MRTLLTLTSVVIGVAGAVAITATTRATHRAYHVLFEAIGGRAALEVVAEGQGGFDAGLVDELATTPGVQAAVGVICTPAALITKNSTTLVITMGVDPIRDVEARGYDLREGRLLADLATGEVGVLLGAEFARPLGLSVGSTARLRSLHGVAELPVVGLLNANGAALVNGGAVVLLPLAEAQRLFGRAGEVNSVQLILGDGTDPERVEKEIVKRLPNGLRVQQPVARGAIGRDNQILIDMSLYGLSVVSLGAVAFVILNSFLMSLGERRRQFAILRALGTTRSQLTQLLLREALLLGLAGTVLGLGLGALLAYGMVVAYGKLLSMNLPPMPLTAESFILAMVLGPGLALTASWLPARFAGRRPPLADLFPVKAGSSSEAARRSSSWAYHYVPFVGLALFLLALSYPLGLARSWWSRDIALALFVPVVLLASIGFVLAMPLALGPILYITRVLLRTCPRRPWSAGVSLLATPAAADGFDGGSPIGRRAGDDRHG